MLEGLRSQCHVVVTAIGVNYFRASNPHFAAVKCHCLCWVAHCPWSLVPFWHCVFATHLYSPLFWPICLPCSAWKENKFWLGKYNKSFGRLPCKSTTYKPGLSWTAVLGRSLGQVSPSHWSRYLFYLFCDVQLKTEDLFEIYELQLYMTEEV